MKRAIFILLMTWIVNQVTLAEVTRSAALVDASHTTANDQEKQALAAVVSRVTGLTAESVLDQSLLLETLRPKVLRHYLDRPAVPTQKLWYHLAIDSGELEQALILADLPIWPPQRPELSVWMVEEPADAPLGEEALTFAQNDSAAAYWLQQGLMHRGIEANFYDPNQNNLLEFSPEDVRFMNPDLIDFLAMENPDAWILLVFVKHNPTGYAYRYGLVQPGQDLVMKSRQFIDLSQGMNAMAQATQQAMAAGKRIPAAKFSARTVAIQINDVNQADDMLQVTAYLDKHALIERYQINQYKSHQLHLTAMIKVTEDTFSEYVSSDGILMHQPVGLGSRLLFVKVP